ncbi:2-amino-4-hydroxy-6-hydroxymethyldihydropteridine diphosphokinase [Legionella longbeachae]|uniref:2-amino-4-hydroxy-6-hydroxymethyldihydropteridine pyrophosphokinase n=1 Tax=Legionella longbeachae serogroup 1 (strain NSW150) TaxID=661367 RepID=D3HSM6_LEGLN|nr:2-amino-4-hydroxy-6-hydroxymethyldihydropteridine diphosphokinase [Legionella longbeachae]VEE02409.1 2-amino-4-hydroxy-6-hydroxymethyldihydropteridinepyrophosphokinase [Legionella oakridgensis]HBD7398100.1 2-amino-4-hydroxy-6-hydroxymethyldihydropteridine diphosphokinase [Legionella pneumophila]ARB91310.1 2-amino-4-hydroxy-6-hydroxymethyldihydropteridine diphosphokinase [Legionella longbeachae]ARM32266.1 2-amino-4-hydroxy-6-hydroxymethyldihydropteridine diphosphokinase [Legionella longbeacha
MNTCYLGLGSNQKNPERQLYKAIQSIKTLRLTSVTKISSFYWSKAWGLKSQQNFCNAVIEISTRLPPLQLLNACQQIEKKQGRVRKKRWGPRIIDIDILYYENRVIQSKMLIIPHPYIQFRDFVLIPLSEINPKLI